MKKQCNQTQKKEDKKYKKLHFIRHYQNAGINNQIFFALKKLSHWNNHTKMRNRTLGWVSKNTNNAKI